MAKMTQLTGASSAAALAKLLAQAAPAQDLTKLLADLMASGKAITNASQALSRHNEKLKNSLNAGEIARAISQIPSTRDLAKQIADVSASNEALKTVSQDLSRNSEAVRNSLNAKGIAETLTSLNALGAVSERLTGAMPQVNLRLPGASEFITAALPRTLPDDYLPRSGGSSDEAQGAAGPRNGETDAIELEIVSASDLGRLVRRAREGRHLSQQSFADLAGVGRRFLSELENGKSTLELGKVLKVANAAGISLLARER